MTAVRSTAVIVGILFVIATGFYMIGQAVYVPILDSPDYLDLAYPQRSRVIAGILIEVVGVLAIPSIALLLYPVLRLHDEASALGYVGVRFLESVALLVVDVNMWGMVSLSRSYLEGGAASTADWQLVGSALQAASESAFLISVAIIFPIGVLLLNSVLWRARLVPRFISGWGLAAGALLLVGSVLSFFEALPAVPPIALEAVLSGPIAIQEMVLAVWLISKGLNESSGTTVPA